MMKITELITRNTIILDLQADTKKGVIDEIANKLDKAGNLSNKEQFKEAIWERENQSTTGIGEGIAIPHAKTSAVRTPSIGFARSKKGVDYDSLDGKPSNLFFMIAASEGANQQHLETLSRLSSFLMDTYFREKLLSANSEEDVLRIIDEKELEVLKEENADMAQKRKILAVTACPTGIAHTYMAADGLKNKAKEMGVEIKVETNGSGGAKNVLTDAEIAEAEVIIVAADKQVEMERFVGKKVLQAPVAEGIRNPGQLIEKALSGDVSIYKGTGKSSDKNESAYKQRSGFYKHLMSGVSNMLPFVVGGGILIALSFIFDNPNSTNPNPFGEVLMTIGGGSAFALMVPVLAAFIAMSIADRPGFAPGMVGGLMAFNGAAGFLGALAAGFLAGYLVVGLKKIFASLPGSLEGIKPVLLYPLFGILGTGLVMHYVIIGPVVEINNGLISWLTQLGTGNLVFLGIVLGLMMAFDMGGPVNKAAFAFGIAMIEAGIYEPHAAIMAGGMVPPLGIALATTFFKNRFTKQEQDAGKTNYIMGASFITEGAIPFAAADPIRVIPSIMVGSAVAGALSMMFKIGLQAPHGGVFVTPLVTGGWFMYLLAIVIGSVVTAIMLAFLKKPLK